MGEKGIDPGAGDPNQGIGMAAMPGPAGLQQALPQQSAPPPQPSSGESVGNTVVDVVTDIVDPLGLHKLF